MFNFRFGTDKIEIDEISTTKIDGPNFISTNFIGTVPNTVHGVNGARVTT